MSHHPDDDLQLIAEDGARPHVPHERWAVLVIDDDDEVHAATRFALSHHLILGRELELVHARSAAEARTVLAQRQDFAVILLDVVMETGDAGLTLVGYIRDVLKLTECRIILRTGQPGYAPELTVFNNYDINDYRTKAELTHTRLITAITAALRSYDQIRTIAENRRGLELIVRAVADLMEQHALTQFAEGVLTQLTALLKLPLDGIVCAQRGSPFDDSERERLYIVGAAGRLAPLIAAPLESLDDARVRQAIEQTIQFGVHQFADDHTTLYLRGAEQEGAVFLETRQPLSDADRQLVEVFAANISACFSNLNYVEKLNFAAYHDALTHLSNRSRFIVQLEQALRDGNGDQVALLIDIDHFADINDGLGHDVGNELLVAVATRLETNLSPACRLARIGADVFGVLGPTDQLQPQQLLTLFHIPFEVGEHLLPVSVKLGYCRLREGGGSGFMLLKRASIALNRAKKHVSSDFDHFSSEMEEHTRWRLDLIRQLKHDFHAGRLVVWYQPQVEIQSGAVIGVEALLRWPGENGFVQPPSVFIPLAEYSGLIVEIGDWVLHEACSAYLALAAVQDRPVRIAVNVSMPQFRAGDLTERVASLLGSRRVPPSALELEITESIAMDEPKTVVAALESLRMLGISIAIDDFGTGYSSLAQLRALPIDRLKIDRAFVDEIRDGKGGLFAETIVTLAKKLGLGIVAEGVETPEQAGFLRALGCGEAQGYFYAKPMPLNELTEWLAARQRH
ncbi:putative bifunctional diguanylate cyclase/phosphodiesterase [Chitinolyticbacter meiyuanensis]|uniref:putative bifunctional diguanylate cyclase/phosphodiesterase n=1 Tax=Chitinolyticbacter meiyuanensis TaxID=682798 RepID=UPI0011E59D80|nr:EAL domain-containing protein [Chitinolyticbacter meiyuanensis]